MTQVTEALPPLNDVLTIAQWLSEITGQDLDNVQRRLLAESNFVGHNVFEAAKDFGLVPHIWNERLLEFYGGTDAFMFETVTWNATRMKHDMRNAVCRALMKHLPQGAKVLCYGDGMGFDSAALARCGFRVTCYEVSGPCLEFARRLFALNGLEISIERSEQNLADEVFDGIVCLDVLEHVPDPIQTVQKFSKWLNETGFLVAHAPFYHVDATRPTHLHSNRRFSGVIEGLYGRAGFFAVETCGPVLNPILLQKQSDNSVTPTLPSRLRLRFAQSIVWIAGYLRHVPRWVAAVVCKPPRKWKQTLNVAVNGGDSERNP